MPSSCILCWFVNLTMHCIKVTSSKETRFGLEWTLQAASYTQHVHQLLPTKKQNSRCLRWQKQWARIGSNWGQGRRDLGPGWERAWYPIETMLTWTEMSSYRIQKQWSQDPTAHLQLDSTCEWLGTQHGPNQLYKTPPWPPRPINSFCKDSVLWSSEVRNRVKTSERMIASFSVWLCSISWNVGGRYTNSKASQSGDLGQPW